jgi:hypothetical protein
VHQCGPLVRFVRDALVELGTDDHLGHPSVRTRGETVADPGIDIETTYLEINNAIEIVLLLIERHEILQRAEVRVVFEPEREILAEIAREPCAGRERNISVDAKPHVHDRIDDELPIVLAPSDNGPDFQIPFCLRKPRLGITELEINAIEEFALGGIGRSEERANPAAV